MRALFLDVDGVLNDHKPFPNRYCGIKPECVASLTTILESAPDLKIVLSTAWRYLVYSGAFNERGFEYLLNIHGAPYDLYHGRIIGVTETDERTCQELGIIKEGGKLDYRWLAEHGYTLRAVQIERYAKANDISAYVVLDDLPLPTPFLIQTQPDVGLSRLEADRALNLLQSQVNISCTNSNLSQLQAQMIASAPKN